MAGKKETTQDAGDRRLSPVTACPMRPCKGKNCPHYDTCKAKADGRQELV